MAKKVTEAIENLKISQLYPVVTNEIANWGDPDLEVIANGMNLILGHTDPEYIVKITACDGAIAFMRFMLCKGKIPGLPEVTTYYGPCGYERSLDRKRTLHAFKMRKYSAVKSDKDTARTPLSTRMSDINTPKNVCTTNSLAILAKLKKQYLSLLQQHNFVDAVEALEEFCKLYPDAEYAVEMPESDWLIDGEQYVNVDPVVDHGAYYN